MKDATDLHDRTIVITGAESGIGREIARACAERGARLVLTGLDATALEETREIARADGALCIHADISQEADVQSLFAAATAKFGTLYGVAANAGISGAKTGIADLTLEAWRRIIEVDLTGTFLTLRAAAAIMIEQGAGGSIVVTGSSTAIRPLPGLLPYVAAKAGVHAMAEALAVELGPHRIRVNTLVPGTTATPLTRAMPGHLDAAARTLPLGEVADAAELGRYVAFALSDALPHMTGSMLKVDSGRTVA